MKKILLSFFLFITIFCCEVNDSTNPVYRRYMREFVQGISDYGRSIRIGFIVIPQNGNELLTQNGENTGPPSLTYMAAIDGVGREDLFYGYAADDQATPAAKVVC